MVSLNVLAMGFNLEVDPVTFEIISGLPKDNGLLMACLAHAIIYNEDDDPCGEAYRMEPIQVGIGEADCIYCDDMQGKQYLSDWFGLTMGD